MPVLLGRALPARRVCERNSDHLKTEALDLAVWHHPHLRDEYVALNPLDLTVAGPCAADGRPMPWPEVD